MSGSVNMTSGHIDNVWPDWIDVNFKLPEGHDWVLVACKLDPEGWYGVPHIAELRNGVWYADCFEVPLENAGVKVTHWMPLPEPPKEV